MSDTPQGGWWKAKDGKWYPPETHPDRVRAASASVAAGPPAAGWWQANDGNWYPPATHPEFGDPGATTATTPDGPLEEPAPAADPVAVPEVDVSSGPDRSPLEPMPVPPAADPAPASASTQPQMGASSSGATPTGWGGFGGSSAEEPSSTWGAVDTADGAMTSGSESASEPAGTSFAGGAATPAAASASAAAVAPSAAGSSSAAPMAEEEGAPLPGWRRGSDGAWYPPGQELPTASRSSGAAPSSGAPRSSDRPVTSSPAADAEDGSSRRPWLLALGAIAGVVVLVVAGLLLFGGGDGDGEEAAATSTTADAPATSAPATSAPTTTAATTTTTVATSSEPPGQVSGTGSAVVGVGRTVTEPLLALATHDGPGAFVLSFVGPDGAVVQQPMGAGVEGTYLGVLPVNFVADQPFDAVRVEGEGPWAVTFAVVQSAPVLPTAAGQVYEGSGDAVLRVSAASDLEVALT